MFTSLVAPVDSADAPLYLPYKALVSTINSMVFSEGEAHRLIEILSEKVGIIQDTWHTVRPHHGHLVKIQSDSKCD